mgnify:CR=1 FL=1
MTLEQTAEEQVGKYLASARRWASQGEAHTMECALRIVGRYAVSVEREKEISAERTAIEAIGYAAAVPVQLASASRWASEGAASVMECALIVAERYAAKSGMDISAQAAEITASLKTRGGK